MQLKFMLIPMLFLVMCTTVLADYNCNPTPITITINTVPTVNVGQPFTITASTIGNPSGNAVYADLVGTLGVLQTVTATCNANNVCTLNFAPIQSSGDYTVRVRTQSPATGANIQATQTFTVNPLLSITLTSPNTIFYYGSDISFRGTITPDVCSNEFLSAKCNHVVELQLGNDRFTVDANRKDIGGGIFDYTIASSEIPVAEVQKGQQSMIIYLTVKDLSNTYGTTTSSLKSISITASTIVTILNVPATASVDAYPRIQINFRVGSVATDVDSFELAVTLPNGQSQVVQESQFIHEQTGQYVYSSLKFTLPQNYYYEVRNIKLNQNGIVIAGSPVTGNTAVNGLNPTPDCGNGQCEPGKGETAITCPADCGNLGYCGDGICQANEDSTNCSADCSSNNWVLYAIIAIIAVIIFIIVYFKMFRK